MYLPCFEACFVFVFCFFQSRLVSEQLIILVWCLGALLLISHPDLTLYELTMHLAGLSKHSLACSQNTPEVVFHACPEFDTLSGVFFSKDVLCHTF